MKNEELDQGFITNRELFKRVNNCIEKLKMKGISCQVLEFVASCSYLINPDRTEIFKNFVENLENYINGNKCDAIQMLTFIGQCKDNEYSSSVSQQKNLKRYKMMSTKKYIGLSLIVALQKYIDEVDQLWTEKTKTDNSEYWTKDQILKDTWEKYQEEILAIQFDQKSFPYYDFSPQALKTIQDKIKNLSLSKFKAIFQKYIGICNEKRGRTTLRGKTIPSRRRLKRVNSKT